MTAPPRKKRYPLRVYGKLILAMAMFAIINYVFSETLKTFLGNYNPVLFSIDLAVLFLFAFIFALMLWAMDTTGSLGRLLGADKDQSSACR